MGSESRLESGRVAGAVPAVASLMVVGGEGRERGACDLMDYGMSSVDWLCDQGL